MRKFIAVLGALVCQATLANQCLDQFYADAPPYLSKQTLKQNTTPICFNGFAVMHSGISKTPLWSAEHLTPQRLSQKIKREDSFHEEDQVPEQYRATLKDYKASGYDRGHMSPNEDMPDSVSQNDSFSLANVIPQAHHNNIDIFWKLEEATRGMITKQNQDVYVVTGPIFSGKKLNSIGNGVLVPTAVYKAVYYPKTGVIGAYLAPNDNSLQVKAVSVCAVEALTGINIFPQLNDALKRKTYDLPLSTTNVKADIAYTGMDTQSQCAPAMTQEQIKQSQNAFGTATSHTSATGWLQTFKNILATLFEFISKMLS
ncbi:DNA/RNA non-specific endonuclease [Acinetobacter sp. HY1485]|uniref:DNA/RNA non-specific endonuclease n=1 Tax=Acinetobacter sp. HY1485 TaxID=2970918 RepID=UPI0022B9B66F|nr:DNA/RNA non-specific endonuclease [Acinetobacter sp. HY1485]